MKFLRSKLGIIVTIIMCGLCLTSIGISVRVTGIAIARRNQVIKQTPSEIEAHKNASDTGSSININKISEQQFFFNGHKIEGASAYVTDQYQYLAPVDVILNAIEKNFNYFSSDDTLESDIGTTKLTLQLGKSTVKLGDREITLPVAPTAAKGHILVPVEFFKEINGFSSDIYAVRDTVFINCYQEYTDKINQNLKVLRLFNDTISLADLFLKKSYWDRPLEGIDEKFEYPGSTSNILLHSGDKLLKLQSKASVAPDWVNIDPAARLSTDGRYLFWIDSNRNLPYIYEVRSGKTRKISDFFLKSGYSSAINIPSDKNIILNDYKESSTYKRVSFRNIQTGETYLFIQRYNKWIVEGKASYSPNTSKVLFDRGGQGYSIVNSDGSGMVSLGQASKAEWVNNSKLLLKVQDSAYIFDTAAKNSMHTDSTWKMVGQTVTGDVLFTRDNTLNIESNGFEYEIANLPGSCSYAWSGSASGPFFAVCDGRPDGIFEINKGIISQVGKFSELLKESRKDDEYDIFTNYKDSIVPSPDGTAFALLQKDQGFLSINLVSGDGQICNTFTLGYSPNRIPGTHPVHVKWLANTRLLVYTRNKGWIIDFSEKAKIYSWNETPNSRIENILP